MKFNPRLITVAVLWILLAISCIAIVAGCETFRFAPTEAQKQNAQLTTDSTGQILTKGTPPGSQTATLAHQSAINTQTYFGPPREPLRPPADVIGQAEIDSSKTPTIDNAGYRVL